MVEVIKCFKHCKQLVFCFELPDFCPECSSDLLTSELKIPPFIFQSPFEDENKAIKSAVLVKPSMFKNFLADYQDGDDLHCGILDENGVVHDYSETGLRTSGVWFQAIRIPVHQNLRLPLSALINQAKFDWLDTKPIYDSVICNCFTFVIWCLHHMGYFTQYDKDEFIKEIILPKTQEAAKYIFLYKKLKECGIFVAKSPPQ